MSVTRRLVAVVVADVVGYSRLMERDESGTHDRLRKLRVDVVDPRIAEHGGRTVKTTGDGMLLEFPSATAALRCAVEVQREMGVRNLYIAADDKIEFRIGINLGDIIVDGDDIVGDGVNVAARLEALAEPGGICVAAAIRDQVKEDLGVELTSLGDQRVKNISKPVRAFRVALTKGAVARPPAPEPAARSRRTGGPRRAIALAGTVVVALAAAAVAWHALPPAGSGSSTTDAPPLHSVMVVPIAAALGDPTLADVAARLTADLTRALGDSMRDMRVTTANAAAAIATRTTDALAAGREANVRYVIEVDLRTSGAQIAVGIRLVDARDGRKIQYENRIFERAVVDDRDALVRSVAYASRIMLRQELVRETIRAGGTPASAQDFVDRIYALSINDPVRLARETRRLADEAIRLDPNFAQGWALRASSSVDLFENDFSIGREPLGEADSDSLRAVATDPRSANAWWVRARVLDYLGNTDAAIAANERAHDLDPTRVSPMLLRGWIALSAGRPADALRAVDSVRGLVDSTSSEPNELACAAHLALGAYDAAIAACERASAADDSFWPHLQLTAAYAMRGDGARAEQARSRMLRLRPDFTIARYEAKRFNSAPAAIEQEQTHLIAGLRKAGVPE